MCALDIFGRTLWSSFKSYIPSGACCSYCHWNRGHSICKYTSVHYAPLLGVSDLLSKLQFYMVRRTSSVRSESEKGLSKTYFYSLFFSFEFFSLLCCGMIGAWFASWKWSHSHDVICTCVEQGKNLDFFSPGIFCCWVVCLNHEMKYNFMLKWVFMHLWRMLFPLYSLPWFSL